MKIRITNAIIGMNACGAISNVTPNEFDPGEYSICTHPSGHIVVELPDQALGFLKFEDFENGVNMGTIQIHN